MTIEYKDSKRFSGLSDGVSSGYDVANISYSGKSSSSSSQSTYMLGIGFNADGTKMYRTGYSVKSIFQYSLSTAWDISTASYDSVSFSLPSPIAVPYGIEWNGDGTKFVVCDTSTGDLYQFSLTTAYDISTTNSTPTTYDPSETTSPDAIKFNSDGTKAFVIGQGNDTVYRYSLSTDYDITTMSYDSNSFTYPSGYYGTGLEFNSDGTEMYIQDHVGNYLRRYTLSTAYDLSTASLTSSFSTSSQFSSQTTSALRFSADGTKLYISGYGASDFQYDTESTASDKTLLTNVQDNSLFVETDTANRYWFTAEGESPTTSAYFGTSNADGASNKHIAIPVPATVSNGAISFWINAGSNATQNADYTAFSFSNSGAASEELIFSYVGQNSNIHVMLRTGSTVLNCYTATNSVTRGEWTHIVYSNDASTGHKIYINGVAQSPTYSTGSAGQNIFSANLTVNSTTIGANRDSGGYQWGMIGYIQDVLLYDKTLTQADVTALYNNGKFSDPDTTNLVRRYVLDGNSNDTSGNSQNGTDTSITYPTTTTVPPTPATWTMQPTWRDDFSTDKGWTNLTSNTSITTKLNYSEVSSTYIRATKDLQDSNALGSGNNMSDNFVIRFELNKTNDAGNTGNGTQPLIGISSATTDGWFNNQDSIGMLISQDTNQTNGIRAVGADNQYTHQGDSADAAYIWTTGIRYCEVIKNATADTVTATLYSDSNYSNSLVTATVSTSGKTFSGLRYLSMRNFADSVRSSTVWEMNNIQVYDGVNTAN